jgi:hypothetical protein
MDNPETLATWDAQDKYPIQNVLDTIMRIQAQ